MRKIVLTLATLTLLAITLLACGGDAPQVVTVVVTATPEPAQTSPPHTQPALATRPTGGTTPPTPTPLPPPATAPTHTPTPTPNSHALPRRQRPLRRPLPRPRPRQCLPLPQRRRQHLLPRPLRPRQQHQLAYPRRRRPPCRRCRTLGTPDG